MLHWEFDTVKSIDNLLRSSILQSTTVVIYENQTLVRFPDDNSLIMKSNDPDRFKCITRGLHKLGQQKWMTQTSSSLLLEDHPNFKVIIRPRQVDE